MLIRAWFAQSRSKIKMMVSINTMNGMYRTNKIKYQKASLKLTTLNLVIPRIIKQLTSIKIENSFFILNRLPNSDPIITASNSPQLTYPVS